MHLYELPLIFVLAGLVLYTVLAGADFGAGFWQLAAGSGERGERIRDHAHHSMAPVWEANHVWLIFVLTVFWTAYPVAFGSIASTLCVPLFIAASRDHLPRRRLRAARGNHDRARGADDRHGLGALLDPHPVRARRRHRRDRLTARARSATPPATCSPAGSTRPRS